MPTDGRLTRAWIPCAANSSGAPMPDSIKSCGVLMTPPESKTSLRATTVRCPPSWFITTPVARVPSRVIFVAVAPVRTVRLGRFRAGRK
jgi:hypothetical protein